MSANQPPDPSAPREIFLPVANARLYVREIGQGHPIIILHGGPDFSHDYLLPDLDLLSSSFCLIYFDQRGRGRSSTGVQPEDVSIASEIEDIEQIRQYFQLEAFALLGHSWGGLLALEYALRHPRRLSHLVLLNTAPASRDDFLMFRHSRLQTVPGDIENMKALSSTALYVQGDIAAEAEYYRHHFRATLRQPQLLEALVSRLRVSFTSSTILQARLIEQRLYNETWQSDAYDLLPLLTQLFETRRLPTLIITGERDFIPPQCSARIASAIPGSRFTLLKDCGHFPFLECPFALYQSIQSFFQDASS